MFGNVCHIATSIYVRHNATLWCLVDFNFTMLHTLRCLEVFVTLWRQDLCITLQLEEMFSILWWQGDVGHIATCIYVHHIVTCIYVCHIVTLLSTLRQHAYFRQIATSLCFVDCNLTMFTTLWPYYVHHIATQYFHHIAMLCVFHSVNLLCLVDFNITMFNTLCHLEISITLRHCNKCFIMQH
jgi:hypothetical protein